MEEEKYFGSEATFAAALYHVDGQNQLNVLVKRRLKHVSGKKQEQNR
jgi:hypothetical protein